MAQSIHLCQCGEMFKTRRHLIEHIGILNPHWPRTSPKDEHKIQLPPPEGHQIPLRKVSKEEDEC